MAGLVRTDRGVALVITLLAIGLFSALGLALTLSSSVERLAGANHEDAGALLNAADAALELAARDLAALTDWDVVLEGNQRSPMTDGVPSGVRTPAPGLTIDLTSLTNLLTCGQPAACTEAAQQAPTAERPWGTNNATWRLFLYGPLTLTGHPRQTTVPYVAVWLGDDSHETDGNPLDDGGGAAKDGRYILRARAEAFGIGGSRRAIEGEFARICTVTASGEVCMPGVRVQAWQVAAGAIP